jgi:hypothetical protein
MRKQIAFAGLLVFVAGLVLADRIMFAPPPRADANPIADTGDEKQSAAKPAQGSASASDTETKKDEGFRFPGDQGGQLLSKLLAPSAPPPDDRSKKQPTAGPGAIEHPRLPPPQIVANMPRIPDEPSSRKLQPGSVPEEFPLSDYHGTPRPPHGQFLPAGELIRLATIDVNLAIPLPVLARPVANRASLDDPSLDTSKEAALSATMPARTQPAPYFRADLPNPFEFREAIQSKTILEENPMPFAGTPKLPR